MVFKQLIEQLQTLSNLLVTLTDRQYSQKNFFLGDASIGGHTRHIIELLKCSTEGYYSGTVDYFNRIRNLSLESQRFTAVKELEILQAEVIKTDKNLKLIMESLDSAPPGYVSTTYYREMVYNTEHTIHHLALIRVALREMKLDIVGNDFGVAYSTSKYRITQK